MGAEPPRESASQARTSPASLKGEATLSQLQRRLVLVATLAAIGSSVLLAAGGYTLETLRLQQATDQALARAISHTLDQRGLSMSPELVLLAHIDRRQSSSITSSGDDDAATHAEADDAPGNASAQHLAAAAADAAAESEIAPITMLVLDANGTVLPTGVAADRALLPDRSAIAAAQLSHLDLRTRTLAAGVRLRVLTVVTGAGVRQLTVQAARVMTDQDHTLTELLLVFTTMGVLSATLAGLGSWLLIGRALRPAWDAWRQQQTFVANASHELRTPLTLLRASIELVHRHLPPSNTDDRTMLEDALQECDHTAHLVDDLLLLSRADAGALSLKLQAVDVVALLGTLERQVRRLAEGQDISLTLHDSQIHILADPTYVRQVLLILLDNALRYTPPGGMITVAARVNGPEVQLTVTDTGCGITADHLPRLFERFYRVDAARGAGAGTGLGLSIAEALIAAQNGRITVQSQPGGGTVFTVTLPVAPP